MGKYIESDIQIRFADADSLGHINNVNLQHYFDVGKMEFYEKVLGKTIDPDAESLTTRIYTHQLPPPEQAPFATRRTDVGGEDRQFERDHLPAPYRPRRRRHQCRLPFGRRRLRLSPTGVLSAEKAWRAKMEEYLRQE